jgi:hypothetical protein
MGWKSVETMRLYISLWRGFFHSALDLLVTDRLLDGPGAPGSGDRMLCQIPQRVLSGTQEKHVLGLASA